MLLKLWIISVSLSIDALGIGMSYRLKGIRVSLLAKMIVGIMVSAVSYGALLVGNKIVMYFPEDVLKIIVTSFLILMGIVFMKKGFYSDEEAFCDRDASASIEPFEAVLLGIGLSMDSVGTGIAVVAIGIYHILLPVLIGVNHVFFLLLGEWVGKKTMKLAGRSQKICGVFSGILLIIIGICHGMG